MYDPLTGRFLSRDEVIKEEKGKDGKVTYKGFPFGDDAIGTNLYVWCKNNPVTNVDPSGHHMETYRVWVHSGYWQWYTVHSGHWVSQRAYYNVVTTVFLAGVVVILATYARWVGLISQEEWLAICTAVVVNTYSYVKSQWVDTSYRAKRWIDTSHWETRQRWVQDPPLLSSKGLVIDCRTGKPTGYPSNVASGGTSHGPSIPWRSIGQTAAEEYPNRDEYETYLDTAKVNYDSRAYYEGWAQETFGSAGEDVTSDAGEAEEGIGAGEIAIDIIIFALFF